MIESKKRKWRGVKSQMNKRSKKNTRCLVWACLGAKVNCRLHIGRSGSKCYHSSLKEVGSAEGPLGSASTGSTHRAREREREANGGSQHHQDSTTSVNSQTAIKEMHWSGWLDNISFSILICCCLRAWVSFTSMQNARGIGVAMKSR